MPEPDGRGKRPHPAPGIAGFGWRRRAAERWARRSTRCSRATASRPRPAGDLSIADRQMVEIALAFSMPVTARGASRDPGRADLVAGCPRGRAAGACAPFVGEGGAAVLISHPLGDSGRRDRIVVMRDGRVVADRPAGDSTRTPWSRRWAAWRATGRRPARRRRATAAPPGPRRLRAWPGEIVGLAGLGGQGQTAALRASFSPGPGIGAAASRVSPSSRATGRPTASFRSGRSCATSPWRPARPRARVAGRPRCRGVARRRMARKPRHPRRHAGGADPVAVGRQSAEGAVRARAGLDRARRADGRPDARRRCRHQAGSLRPIRDEAGRPHLPLVHDRDGRVALCDHVYVFRDGGIVADPRRRGDRGRVLAASFAGEAA